MQIGINIRAAHYPLPGGWPNPPSLLGGNDSRQDWEEALAEAKWADTAGFDFVSVSEHHYSAYTDPNPLMTAAVLTQHMKNARICLLGATVTLLNPVRVAEEMAMLDVMANGRLTVALLRGTPNEAITYYNLNPNESRAKFEEAVALVRACWTEPEPFAWEGRYYRFRTVSVWPRSVTPGGPRLLLSGSNPVAIEYVAENHADFGVSFVDLDDAIERSNLFYQSARNHGWEATPENVLYRNFCYVSNTDEQAYEEAKQHRFGSLKQMFAPDSLLTTHAVMESVTGSYQDMPTSQARHLIEDYVAPPLCGSPETVIEQIKQLHDAGIGQVDLLLSGIGLPQEMSVKNRELFANEVLPAVREFANIPQPV